MSKTLSNAQEYALTLLPTAWTSMDQLRRSTTIALSHATFDALVNKGYAEKRVKQGASFPGMKDLQTSYRKIPKV